MPDFAQGKLYRMECPRGYFYIGSTCDLLSYRLTKHKYDSARHPNRKSYQQFKISGWEHVKIELISAYPCSSKEELLQEENRLVQQHITNPFCVNTYVPISTAEETRLKTLSRVTCECGGSYTRANKTHHMLTIKHHSAMSAVTSLCFI